MELVSKMKLPVQTLSLSGGCSGNLEFQKVMRSVARDYDLNIIIPKKEYIQNNAASIAWMGWEYLNSNWITDISSRNIHSLNNIPLGNFIDYMGSSFKGVGRAKKFGSKWQRELSGRN